MSFLSRVLPCLNNDDDPPAPAPAPVSTSLWDIQHSQGMPAAMLAGDGGYYFDFPQAPGSVHYVTRGVTEAGRSSVHMRFKIIGDGAIVPTEGVDSAKVRLMVQRRGDTLQAGTAEQPTVYEDYRFWSPPLDLNAAGEFVLEAPLSGWTSVFGRQNDMGPCLADLDRVGFTFGGTFAGHGVYTTGSARFVLIDYRVD